MVEPRNQQDVMGRLAEGMLLAFGFWCRLLALHSDDVGLGKAQAGCNHLGLDDHLPPLLSGGGLDVLERRPEVRASDGSVGELQMSLHKAVYQTVDVPYRKVAY